MIKQQPSWLETKNFSLIFAAGYAALYLLTRLVNLTLLPAHFDELVYLQYAGQLVNEGHWLVGLENELKWTHLWLIAAFYWLPASPLWIGRFASTLMGLAAGLGCYALGVELFGRRSVGVLAALLYLITPFVVLYDRLALSDALLTGLTAWVMVFSLWAIRRRQLRWATAAGLVIALASLTKTPGLYNLLVPAAVLLLFWPGRSRRLIGVLALIYGLAAFGPLTLLLAVNATALSIILPHVATPGTADGAHILLNAQNALSWLTNLVTLPLVAFGLLGAVLVLVRRWAGLLLFAPLLIIPTAFIVASDIWYPRYLLPVVPPLLLLAAVALDEARRWLAEFSWGRFAFAPLLLLALLPSLQMSFWLLVDPPRAALHPEERRQYIEGWPNAYGLAEAAAFVTEQGKTTPHLYLAINDHSFLVQQGLKYYFDAPPNVEVVEYDPFGGQALQQLNHWAMQQPTYLILNSAREKGLNELETNPELFIQGRERASFAKPGGQASIDVVQWLSAPALAEWWAQRSGITAPVIAASLPAPGDATGAARFTPFDPANLANADFVLLDAATLNAGAAAVLGQPASGSDWLNQLPPNWELTLAVPGFWYLWRIADNAPPQQSLQTLLAEQIELTGFDLPQKQIAAGQSVAITLHWQARQDMLEDVVVFAQLIGPDGQLYAQQDAAPFWPTSRWRAGQKLAAAIDIPLPPDMPANSYQLIVGMYQPASGQRLPAVDAAGREWPNDAVPLATVEVTAP